MKKVIKLAACLCLTSMLISQDDVSFGHKVKNAFNSTGRFLYRHSGTIKRTVFRIARIAVPVGASIAVGFQAPEPLRAPVIVGCLYSIWLLMSMRLKHCESEKYFESGVPNGIGDILETHIKKFLPSPGSPAKTDQEIYDWVSNELKLKALYKVCRAKLIEYHRDHDLVYDEDAVLDQICRDIHAFGYGFHGREMHTIGAFNSGAITGLSWGKWNFFNLRYGSSSYKLILMKMLLLRDVLRMGHQSFSDL